MLPNFILIGAAKCGTSSLSGVLRGHPDVFISNPREIGFFGVKDVVRDRDWYERFFADAGGYKAIGEGSTLCTHPDIISKCASEIRSIIPDCRLIYMVRHPLKRLESDWKTRVIDRVCDEPIAAAIETYPNLVRHGNYWANLNVYRSVFPDEQIRVVFLDDFRKTPNEISSMLFDHIGVAPLNVDGETHRHKTAELRQDTALGAKLRSLSFFESMKAAMPKWMLNASKKVFTREPNVVVEWDPAVRRRVVESWREDSERLFEFCGKPSGYWKYDEA